MKRRNLIRNLAAVSGFAAFASITTLLSCTAGAEERRGKKPDYAGYEMLNPNDGVAKALGYVEDAKKSRKAGNKKCATCKLFSKTENKNDREVGTCSLFAKKLVVAGGFCNSWVKV